MASTVSKPVELKSPPYSRFPHTCFGDIRRLPVASPGRLIADVLRKGHRCSSYLRVHSRKGCLEGSIPVHSTAHKRESHAIAASAPAGTAGGAATYDPTVARSPPATVGPASEPLAEPGRGGGGNDGGWKSPPGGSGGGGSSWWDGYSEWWENHNPFNTISLGLRMRTAADPSFFFKLAVECGLDATIIVVVNLLARKERFISELEFVLSQIAVSLLNDFALVYLLAPTPECSVLQRGSLRAKLAELPAHVFQRAPLGLKRGYPLSARLACFLAKAVQYGTVGLVMGTTGSSLILGLTSLRTALDKDYQPPPTYQPVLGTGLGWLLFMSGSSNVRYNLINLAEDLAYERFPGTRSKVLSIALRFSNNIFGAHAWMHMAETLNLNRPRKQKRSRDLKPAPEGDLITEVPPAH